MFSSDLQRDVANLKTVADTYTAALLKEKDILNHQNSNHDNALNSVIQSRDSINANASRLYESQVAEFEKKLCKTQEYIRKLREAEHSLATEDLDYENYLLSASEATDIEIPLNIDSAISFLERTELAVQTMVSECRQTKRSFLARVFVRNIPQQRTDLYQRIHNAICAGIRVANYFETNSWSQKNEIRDRIDIDRQNQLMNAAEEAQKIADMSIQQSQVAIMSVVNAFSQWLQINFPSTETETLEIIMDDAHDYEVGSSFSEAIVIGRIAQCVTIEDSSYVSRRFSEHAKGLLSDGKLFFPAVQRLRTITNIMLLSEDEAAVARAMEALMFCSLVSQPALRQRIYIFDPISHGTSFRDMLPFVKQFPSVTAGNVMTNRQQIKKCLDEMVLRMDSQLQTILINNDTIYDYNDTASERPEALTYLCLYHFPREFDDDMLKKLLSLMENGNRCGIQVVLDCDEAAIPVSRPDIEELLFNLRSRCLVMHNEGTEWYFDAKGVIWIPPRFPNEREMNAFIDSYMTFAKASMNTILPLTAICGRRYGMNSARMLSIPIGKNGDGTIRNLEFGDPVSQGTSHHALVFGSLGSGKSTLLHTIIMSAVQNYSPDEVNLYLLDFKEGTEFKIYETMKIPHIKVLALDALQEFGMSVLEEITSIAKQRLELFTKETEKGNNVKNISQYRETTGKSMPRILVIMDEFQMLFNQDANRRVANACAKLFSDIVALYRVCGIHCILATQTMRRIKSGNFAISAATMDEMKVRIGLKCDRSECDLIFKDVYGETAFRYMGEGRGEGVYTENVENDEPHGFKVAFCSNQEQENILRELGNINNGEMLVFTGKTVPPFLQGWKYEWFDVPGRPYTGFIFLGIPIRIDEPLVLAIRRQRNTLFVCGGNSDLTDKVISSYLMSCAIKDIGLAESIYLFDGNTIFEGAPSERVRYAMEFAAGKEYMEPNPSVPLKKCNSVFDVIPLVDEVYSIYIERRQTIHAGTYKGGRIYVIINDLQMIEPLYLLLNGKAVDDYIIPAESEGDVQIGASTEEDKYGLLAAMDLMSFELGKSAQPDAIVPPHKKLSTLLNSGHTCNIHIVVSCADLQPLRNVLYDFIPLFSNRIIHSMNNLDAGRIIPDANLENMLPNVALYSDGKNPPYQFKPYDIMIKED